MADNNIQNNGVIVFDKGTPKILDASKVKSLLATNSENELVGSVEIDLLIQESANRVGVVGAQLPAVNGGTMEIPTVLSHPGTTAFRFRKASPGIYSFGENVFTATSGKEWIFEWNDSSWSLKDMGALPIQDISEIENIAHGLDDNLRKPETLTENDFSVEMGVSGYKKTQPVAVKKGQVATVYSYSNHQKGEFYNSLGEKVAEFGEEGLYQDELRSFQYTAPDDGFIAGVSYTLSGQGYKVEFQGTKIYLAAGELDTEGGALSYDSGKKLLENNKGTGETEVRSFDSSYFDTPFGNGYFTTVKTPVQKGDMVNVSGYSAYQILELYDSQLVKMGEVVGNGTTNTLSTKSYKVGDGVHYISALSLKDTGLSNITLTITRQGVIPIYATPEDLEKVKSSLFDVGNSFEMAKPDTIVKIDFKTLSPLPDSKEAGKINGTCRIQVGNLVFEKFATLEVQGSSSAVYPKKNWTFQFFNDEARTSTFKLRIDNGVFLDEWVYKASWIDATMVRNIVANRLWRQMEQTRSGHYKRDIDRFYEGTAKTGYQQYDTGATGVVDGYPAEMSVNSAFYGIGTFNSGKKRDNYNLNNGNANHIQIETGATQMDFVNMTLANGDYEYRSPKVITPDVEAKIQQFKTLAGLAQSEFTAQLPTVFDTRNLTDYIIFVQYLFLPDNLGNNIMLTRWFDKFLLFVYDLDNSFGLRWDGQYIWPTNLNVFDSKGDLPSNTKDFWKKAKVALSSQLASRYSELKSKGILTADNVLKLYKEMEVFYTQARYKQEFDKWDLPSKNLTGQNQIYTFCQNRIAWLDTYFV